MVSRQVLNYVNKLSTGDHVVLFYEASEDESEVLFTFLKKGLEMGEEAVYITDIASASMVRNAMKCFGIDPSRVTIIDLATQERAQRSGILLDLEIEWSPKGIVDFWKRWLQYQKKKARLAVNLAFSIHHPPAQLALEKAFGCILHMPMTMICAYSSKEITEIWEGKLFIDLIKTHGHAIFPGITFKLK